MRLGPFMIRTTGPCIRCTATTTDYTTGKRCPENEPLSTLNQLRGTKGEGPYFGTYHQPQILNKSQFEQLGVGSFAQALDEHPAFYRSQDQTTYYRVRVGDVFKTRLIQEPKWYANFKKKDAKC